MNLAQVAARNDIKNVDLQRMSEILLIVLNQPYKVPKEHISHIYMRNISLASPKTNCRLSLEFQKELEVWRVVMTERLSDGTDLPTHVKVYSPEEYLAALTEFHDVALRYRMPKFLNIEHLLEKIQQQYEPLSCGL